MKQLISQRIICILLFSVVWLFSGCGQQHPPALLHNAKGESVALAGWKGNWIVLNYWATWCNHCVDEMAMLNGFAVRHAGDHVRVYGVNYDHLQGKDLLAAIQQLHITFPVLQEDPRDYLTFQLPEVLPVTVIVDPQGRAVRQIPGPVTAQSLSAVLDELREA